MTTDSEVITKIEAALEELRPFLKADGGDIALLEVTDDFVVKLEFLGACKNCSISMSTFKAGVEITVKRAGYSEGIEIDGTFSRLKYRYPRGPQHGALGSALIKDLAYVKVLPDSKEEPVVPVRHFGRRSKGSSYKRAVRTNLRIV